MAKFNPGDRVLVNGTQVATIRVYDEQSGQLVLEQPEIPNTIYGPIGSYKLEALATEASAVASDEPETAPADDEADDEGPKDEFTTSALGL